jgi:hypothetical protein
MDYSLLRNTADLRESFGGQCLPNAEGASSSNRTNLSGTKDPGLIHS